jgi:hypothetical protein
MVINEPVDLAPSIVWWKSMFFSIKKMRTWNTTISVDKNIAYYLGLVNHSKFSEVEKSQKSKVPSSPFSPVCRYAVKYLMINGLDRLIACTKIFQNKILRYSHLKAVKTVKNKMFVPFFDLLDCHFFSSIGKAASIFSESWRSPYYSRAILRDLLVNLIIGLVQLKNNRLQQPA